MAGLGSPLPSQWITPHVERSTEVGAILEEFDLVGQAHSFIGETGPLGRTRATVEAAWRLDDLAADNDEFVRTFAAAEPCSDRECMIYRVQLVQAWRRFRYRDPDLPACRGSCPRPGRVITPSCSSRTGETRGASIVALLAVPRRRVMTWTV